MQKVRQKEITKEISSKAIDVFKSDWDKYEWIKIIVLSLTMPRI